MNPVTHGMRFRTIKSTIRRKLDDWLKSIDNPDLVRAIRNDVIVSGGAIATMSTGEGVNDYDVYFRTKATAINVALYYISKFQEVNKELTTPIPSLRASHVKNIKGEDEERLLMHIQSAGAVEVNAPPYQYFETTADWEQRNYFEPKSVLEDDVESTDANPDLVYAAVSGGKGKDRPYSPVFFTNNAITLTGDIQLVIRFFGEPAKLHTNYDFVHCMSYYDYRSDKLEVTPDAMQCMLERTLVYAGSLYPLCTLMRLRKFISRGWRIDAGEMLKIAYNVGEVNFQDPDMLKEQLMGVDVAYMHQFIGALTIARKEGKRITPTYFAELLDRCYD